MSSKTYKWPRQENRGKTWKTLPWDCMNVEPEANHICSFTENMFCGNPAWFYLVSINDRLSVSWIGNFPAAFASYRCSCNSNVVTTRLIQELSNYEYPWTQISAYQLLLTISKFCEVRKFNAINKDSSLIRLQNRIKLYFHVDIRSFRIQLDIILMSTRRFS